MAKIKVVLTFPKSGTPFARIKGRDAKFELSPVKADAFCNAVDHPDAPNAVKKFGREIRKQLNAKKPFKCSECDKRFASPAKALLHKYKFHQTQD